MQLEDYTADSICHSMSLPGFVEQPWLQAEKPTLRVVLTPSFHPELCITLAQRSDSSLLSVVVLLEQFWAQRSLVRLPHEREEVTLPVAASTEILALFSVAHASLDPEKRDICIDGMGSESCLVTKAGTQRLHSHVFSKAAIGQFVAQLVELAWNSCRRPQVRNALARAASYMDVEYPLLDVPREPTITRVAILGTPEARRDYFEMLLRNKRSGAEDAHEP